MINCTLTKRVLIMEKIHVEYGEIEIVDTRPEII